MRMRRTRRRQPTDHESESLRSVKKAKSCGVAGSVKRQCVKEAFWGEAEEEKRLERRRAER